MGLKQSKNKRKNDNLAVNINQSAKKGAALASFKITFVGDSGVGKTSLIERIAEGKFTVDVTTYTPDKKDKIVLSSAGKEVNLELWDTAGQERFRTITSSYYRGAHCLCLVCDVTSKESADNVAYWYHEAQRYAAEDTQLILLANKTDLPQRVVSAEDLQKSAENMNAPLFELSAKTDANVTETFRKIADLLVEAHDN